MRNLTQIIWKNFLVLFKLHINFFQIFLEDFDVLPRKFSKYEIFKKNNGIIIRNKPLTTGENFSEIYPMDKLLRLCKIWVFFTLFYTASFVITHYRIFCTSTWHYANPEDDGRMDVGPKFVHNESMRGIFVSW